MMNKSNLTSLLIKSATGAIMIYSSFASSSAYAELNIPNPLVRPQPTKVDNTNSGPLPQPGQQASTPGNAPPANYVTPINNGLNNPNQPVGTAIPHSSFMEVKEKFSAFYVSAIVGNRAILRRYNQANQRNGGLAPANNGVVNSYSSQTSFATSPNGIMNSTQQTSMLQVQNPNDSFTVKDGEDVDFLGDSVTLTAKVTDNRVYIYFSDDGNGTKKDAKFKRVAFIGQVESSIASTPAPVVLERKDTSFSQRLDVTPKTRGTNGGSTTNSGNSNSNGMTSSSPSTFVQSGPN